MNKATIITSIASLGFWLALSSGAALAQMPHAAMQHTAESAGQFHKIAQPLWVKGAVTAGGLGLIALELWWFLLSKPKSRNATTQGDINDGDRVHT